MQQQLSQLRTVLLVDWLLQLLLLRLRCLLGAQFVVLGVQFVVLGVQFVGVGLEEESLLRSLRLRRQRIRRIASCLALMMRMMLEASSRRTVSILALMMMMRSSIKWGKLAGGLVNLLSPAYWASVPGESGCT
jgi:hypothetical protein